VLIKELLEAKKIDDAAEIIAEIQRIVNDLKKGSPTPWSFNHWAFDRVTGGQWDCLSAYLFELNKHETGVEKAKLEKPLMMFTLRWLHSLSDTVSDEFDVVRSEAFPQFERWLEFLDRLRYNYPELSAVKTSFKQLRADMGEK
jgi:hypothetical protein